MKVVSTVSPFSHSVNCRLRGSVAGREAVLLTSASTSSAVHLVAHACRVDLSALCLSLRQCCLCPPHKAESVCLSSSEQIVHLTRALLPVLFRFFAISKTIRATASPGPCLLPSWKSQQNAEAASRLHKYYALLPHTSASCDLTDNLFTSPTTTTFTFPYSLG